jgi:hypothetical protein
MDNRNNKLLVIGSFVVICLISALLWLVNSAPEVNMQKSYNVKIYHCDKIAPNESFLRQELSLFLLSTALPSSNDFIFPVIDLHERLNGGDSIRLSVPMTGLSSLRELLNSDYYDYQVRKSEEEDLLLDLFEEGFLDRLFKSDKYVGFKLKAIAFGDSAVNLILPNSTNSITEFFINANQSFTNSSDNKVWNSLASLKVYINGLIAANKITAGSVIKVYYQCGVAPPPSDYDGDGFNATKDCNDNDAQINEAVEEVCGDSKDNNCDGIIDEGCDRIEPPKPPISGGSGPKSNSPTNFNIIDSRVGWDNGPDELELKFEVYKADGTNPSVKVKMKRGSECIISKDEHDELSGSLKSVGGKLSGSVFYRSGSSWVFTNLVVDCTKLQYN